MERAQPAPCCRYSARTRKNDAWPHQNTVWATSPALNVRCTNRLRMEQRRAAAAGQPALVDDEAAEQDRRDGQRHPSPQRPAVLATLDQRQDDRGQPGGDQGGADAVDPARLLGSAGLGNHPRRQRQRQQTRSGR